MFNEGIVELACKYLNAGEVVAIPTETVYGLAVDSTNDLAIAKLYELKKRPNFNPLILHVVSFEQAQKFGVFSEQAKKIAKAFWRPNTKEHRPITLVVELKKDTGISKLGTSGLDTIAIRVPDNEFVQLLLKEYKNPLFAPSANISTQLSATNAEIIRRNFFNKIPLIVDYGQCRVGIESTILDMSIGDECVVLRNGGTTLEDIASVIGYVPQANELTDAIKAPGMLKKHYAPQLPLFTKKTQPRENCAFLGFGDIDFGEYNLSKNGCLVEAASNLFKMLFELDDVVAFKAIYVAPIPENGLGLAINDRLERASYKEF